MNRMAKTAVLALGVAGASLLPETAAARSSWYVNVGPGGYSFGYYQTPKYRYYRPYYRPARWHYHGNDTWHLHRSRAYRPPYYYTGWYGW
jgi:hypothetical protein